MATKYTIILSLAFTRCLATKIGVCHGTTSRECSDFSSPETCLLMGCQAVFPYDELSRMCLCTSLMKTCGEFATNFECEHVAGCTWTNHDNTPDTDAACPEDNLATPSPISKNPPPTLNDDVNQDTPFPTCKTSPTSQTTITTITDSPSDMQNIGDSDDSDDFDDFTPSPTAQTPTPSSRDSPWNKSGDPYDSKHPIQRRGDSHDSGDSDDVRPSPTSTISLTSTPIRSFTDSPWNKNPTQSKDDSDDVDDLTPRPTTNESYDDNQVTSYPTSQTPTPSFTDSPWNKSGDSDDSEHSMHSGGDHDDSYDYVTDDSKDSDDDNVTPSPTSKTSTTSLRDSPWNKSGDSENDSKDTDDVISSGDRGISLTPNPTASSESNKLDNDHESLAPTFSPTSSPASSELVLGQASTSSHLSPKKIVYIVGVAVGVMGFQ